MTEQEQKDALKTYWKEDDAEKINSFIDWCRENKVNEKASAGQVAAILNIFKERQV